MAIPDYQTLMLPLLKYCGDGQIHSLQEIIGALATEFSLSPQEKKELLPSGRQAVFDNRAGWARTYVKKAGLLDSPRRGYVVITERGKQILANPPDRLTSKYLEQFPEFIEFRDSPTSERSATVAEADADVSTETPEEALENAYQQMRESLANELLERVKGCSADFFERLVVELLVAMGYGGSRRDAGEKVGGSGDGGIDGIIKEDRLGLDVIYIQAKRWVNTVGRPEIQKFVGALQGQRARKGVFITTSNFTREATDYAANLESKVILLDGRSLAHLMVDFEIGATKAATYDVKRLDTDYFAEE